ncbi:MULTISPECIES: murein biosynthesis integral membrane protein MurJ [unclassified Chelatococcus]|uniref:murein biosynthesis integral membrane protein MurJ n=1 Tax=unclassified Chelatococcus TaxID=2638111 RepID=UPI001BCFF799|nr:MULTISPECIES: murein biosynthesis integral membrane protein MurJ [unclassified Chelatococcus]MBS7696964.1 murein biosynthesis integral membrane protein MurJ [Chelatococcus sp. YT9]MBX3555954.1 murein biosynthesis integral membrane protein MurJ [Chelatococcus sp.]
MSLARSSLLVGSAAIASRLIGFARDVMIARALGAGMAADAFLLAFRLPNVARRVFGEGGLNAGFVPLYSRIRAERGEVEAGRFAGQAMSSVAVVLLAVTAFVELAAPLVVIALGAGYAAEVDKFALAVTYTRLAFPFVALAGLASLVGAYLNADRRYTAAALAPVLVNVLMIAVLLMLDVPDEETAIRQGWWLALAVSTSGLVHLGIVVAALLRHPGSFAWHRPRLTPDIRRLARRVLPATAASGATQLAVVVATAVASQEASAVSWLYYADRVAQLPLSLIGVAVGTVLLSEVAARLAAGDHKGAAVAQARALEGALGLALPAAVALVILAEPISVILFQRGAFGPEDAAGTAVLLRMLALGLPAAAIAKVLAQPFFAREALRIPIVGGLSCLVVTGLAGYALKSVLGIAGIGLGLSLGLGVNALVLWGAARSTSEASPVGMTRRVMLMLAASLVMGVGLEAGMRWLAPWLLVDHLAARAGALALLCCGGLALYVGMAFATGAIPPQFLRWRRS